MKVAVIGSRNVTVENMEKYIPEGTTEIVSGGAKGVDKRAKEYAIEKGLKIKEFFPEYEKFGRVAPIKRNDLIIEYSDKVVALWDGESKGTKYVIDACKNQGKEIAVFLIGSVPTND